jgi:site-specific DNA recombinase
VKRTAALLSLIDRVELGQGSFRATISWGALLGGGHAGVTLARELPLAIKRRGVEMRLISDSHDASPAKADPILLKEVARAHRCFDALLNRRASSIAVLAAREGIHDRYVSSLLPLAFLSPEIVEAIVRGTQPKDLTAKKLIGRIHLPLEWQSQKQALGFT